MRSEHENGNIRDVVHSDYKQIFYGLFQKIKSRSKHFKKHKNDMEITPGSIYFFLRLNSAFAKMFSYFQYSLIYVINYYSKTF